MKTTTFILAVILCTTMATLTYARRAHYNDDEEWDFYPDADKYGKLLHFGLYRYSPEEIESLNQKVKNARTLDDLARSCRSSKKCCRYVERQAMGSKISGGPRIMSFGAEKYFLSLMNFYSNECHAEVHHIKAKDVPENSRYRWFITYSEYYQK